MATCKCLVYLLIPAKKFNDVYWDVTDSKKQFFSPIKALQRRNTADAILWATADQWWPYCRLSYCAASGLGLHRGPVCLDCVNNASDYCSSHCALFDTQSNLLFAISVESTSKNIFGKFCPCALSLSPAWFIASVSGVQCTEVKRGNVIYYPLGL